MEHFFYDEMEILEFRELFSIETHGRILLCEKKKEILKIMKHFKLRCYANY